MRRVPIPRKVHTIMPATGGSFTPSDVSSLVYHWDVEENVTLSGSNVTSWNAVNTSQLLTAGVGKEPDFDSADSNFGGNPSMNHVKANSDFLVATSVADCTTDKAHIFLPVRLNTTTANQTVFDWLNNANWNSGIFLYYSGTQLIFRTNTTTDAITSLAHTYTVGGTDLIELIYDSSLGSDNKKLIINGTQVAQQTLSGTKTLTNVLNKIHIGVGAPENNFFADNLDTADVVVCNDVLSGDDLTNMRDYLNTKFGI